MATVEEKKEQIADFLRTQGQSEAATKLLGIGGMGRVSFSTHVELTVSDSFNGEVLTVGVNWSALGTVNVAETQLMADTLTQAAFMARCIQVIIDGAAS